MAREPAPVTKVVDVLVEGRAVINKPRSAVIGLLDSLGVHWYDRDGRIVIDLSPRIALELGRTATAQERSAGRRRPVKPAS